MKSIEKEKLIKILKVLSNKIRLDIILLLISGEKCVCEIYKKLNLPQNLISHHLSILRENKLIFNRRDSKWIYYSLNPLLFSDLKKFMKIIVSAKKTKNKLKC